MKTTSGLILIFIGVTLAACAPVEASPIPPPTNTSSPQIFDFLEDIPIGKATPTLAVTATQLSSIVVPDWLGNPDVNVLMTLTGSRENPYFLSFYNAATGEKFTPPEFIDSGAYFWMPDGKAFGLVSRDEQYIYLVNIRNGEIRQYTPGQNALKLIYPPREDEAMGHVFAIGSMPNNDDFVLVEGYYDDYYYNSVLSADGRFYADIVLPGYSHTILEEVYTGKVIPITDPEDSLYDLKTAWNPSGTQLAILQNSSAAGRGKSKGAYQLIIYDPITREFIASYKNVKGINWSRDGLQILYDSQGQGFYGNAYDYGSVPCIFTISTQETICLPFIRNHHGKIGLYAYTFSPDSSQISYTYSYVIQDPYQELGGLCITNLDLHTIFCPTDNIPEIRDGGRSGLNVLSHSWSPDGNYISFIIGSGCPSCDTGSAHPQIVIMSTDGYDYLMLDETNFDYFPGLWRPPITD